MKKNILIRIILLMIAVNSLHAQLVHPGVSHTKSDLERMKHMVDAEMEPWISSFNSLKADGKSSYNYNVNGDTSITEIDGSNGGFLNDCYAAYYNALMWYITEDSRHAEKSIEIFNSWVNLTSVTGIPLSQGRGPWKLLEGAEIIKHTYTGWSTADQQAFSDMLVYPGYSTTSVPSGNTSFYWGIYQGDSGRHGNQGLFAMRSMMAMGIFLDNEIMYDRALRYIQGLPHRIDDLPYPSGPSINGTTNISGCDYFEEYTRSGDGTAIPDYGYNEVMSNYIYENGQSQESSRDQAHALGGVSIISCITEIAWSQGDDLYGHLDNRLLLGLEFYYRYNLSFIKSFPDQLTPWEPTVASGEYIERTDRSGRWKALRVNPYLVCDTSPEKLHRGRTNLLVAPVFEQSLGHYKDRLLLDAENYKWLERGFENLTEEIGFEDGRNAVDHAGWGGLKFRRVSPGDPISGFDGNGLPVYKMNELPMTIEAENYDYFVIDGNQRTYLDVDPTNLGGEYRTDEGVDIEVCTEGGYNLNNLALGEWVSYTINVPETKVYDISVRYASGNGLGAIKFSLNGEDIMNNVDLPETGGLQSWSSLTVAEGVLLSQGVHSLKFHVGGDISTSYNLNAFTISESSTCVTSFSENPSQFETGIDYAYYEGVWSALPNFENLTPVASGTSTSIALGLETEASGFGYQYEGYILISTEGNYTFYTSSIDGSNLKINGALIVNNDGVHGSAEQQGTVCLQSGYHKLSVSYFNNSATKALSVSYSGPGIAKTDVSSILYKKLPCDVLTDFDCDEILNDDDDDIDGDGVLNTEDQCPETLLGSVVDSEGCAVFSLAANNYTIQNIGERCAVSNDGSISISAIATYNYTATLSLNGTEIDSEDFTQSTSFTNLEAGSYELCITVSEDANYEKCFTNLITEPAALDVQVSINDKSSELTLKLNGGTSYTVNLNGERHITSQSEITLALSSSKENKLSVTTDKDCQGTYEETILLGNDIKVYPNPITEGKLNIVLPKLEQSGQLELYTIRGGMILQQSFAEKAEELQLDVESIPVGTYILKVTQGDQIMSKLLVIN